MQKPKQQNRQTPLPNGVQLPVTFVDRFQQKPASLQSLRKHIRVHKLSDTLKDTVYKWLSFSHFKQGKRSLPEWFWRIQSSKKLPKAKLSPIMSQNGLPQHTNNTLQLSVPCSVCDLQLLALPFFLSRIFLWREGRRSCSFLLTWDIRRTTFPSTACKKNCRLPQGCVDLVPKEQLK